MTTPSRFSILAYTGGKLRVTGFDLPVVVDLAGLTAEGEIPITIKHDTGDATILGQTDPEQIVNDGRSLMLAGAVTADPELSPSVKRVIAMHDKGHKWQASIGAQIEESTDIAAGQTVNVNGQNIEGPFTLATASVLRETAVLGMGADRKTTVTLSAEATLNLTAEADDVADTDEAFSVWAKDHLGLKQDPGTLGEAGLVALKSLYAQSLREMADQIELGGSDAAEAMTDETEQPIVEAGETPIPDQSNDPEKKEPTMSAEADIELKAETDAGIIASRKARAAEIRRQAAIEAKCGGDKMLLAKAIDGGWSEEKAELEFLRRRNAKAPAGHVVSESRADTLQALQGGMLLRAGVRLDNPAFATEKGYALKLPAWLRAKAK